MMDEKRVLKEVSMNYSEDTNLQSSSLKSPLSESNSERRLNKADTENIPIEFKENNPKSLQEAASEVAAAHDILNNTTSTPKAPIPSKNPAFTFDLQKTVEKKTPINRTLCLNSPRNDSLDFLAANFNNLGLGVDEKGSTNRLSQTILSDDEDQFLECQSFNDATANLSGKTLEVSNANLGEEKSGEKTILLGKNDVTYNQEEASIASEKINETFDTNVEAAPVNNVTVDVEVLEKFDATFDNNVVLCEVEFVEVHQEFEEPKFEAEPELAQNPEPAPNSAPENSTEIQKPEDFDLKSESSGKTFDFEPDSLNVSVAGILEIPLDKFEDQGRNLHEKIEEFSFEQEIQKVEENLLGSFDKIHSEVPENPLEVQENPLEVQENPLEVQENPLRVAEDPSNVPDIQKIPPKSFEPPEKIPIEYFPGSQPEDATNFPMNSSNGGSEKPSYSATDKQALEPSETTEIALKKQPKNLQKVGENLVGKPEEIFQEPPIEVKSDEPEKPQEIPDILVQQTAEVLVHNVSENLENTSALSEKNLSGMSENLKNELELEMAKEEFALTLKDVQESNAATEIQSGFKNAPKILPEQVEDMEVDEFEMDVPAPPQGEDQFESKDFPTMNEGIVNPFEPQMQDFQPQFKMPEVPKIKTRKSDPFEGNNKNFGMPDDEFKCGAGFNFESVDFDYLDQFGSNLSVPEDDTRNSVLLKFDPLLKKPVQVTAQNPALNQRKLPITKEEDDFEGLTLKILDPVEVELQVQGIKQEFLSHNNSLDSIEGGKLNSFDNVKMKDFIVPEKNESNHFDCEDVKLSSHDQSAERKMADLEDKIKNEVLKTEEIENKLKESEMREEALLKRITEKDKTIAKMSGVVEAYEKAIAELIAEKEQMQQNFDKQCSELRHDSEINAQHLASLETTFSDIHAKYERAKQIAAELKEREEILLQERKQNSENLRMQEIRYDKMKSHAMAQLEIANNKFAEMTRNHSAEVTKLKAILRKEEISKASMSEQLLQKTKENEELVKICDELINGSQAS